MYIVFTIVFIEGFLIANIHTSFTLYTLHMFINYYTAALVTMVISISSKAPIEYEPIFLYSTNYGYLHKYLSIMYSNGYLIGILSSIIVTKYLI